MARPEITRKKLAGLIDHAVLRPEATSADLKEAASLAAAERLASLCVRPCDVSAARKLLKGTGVAVSTVISFPHGSTSTPTKAAETAQALIDGAEEFDMVLNIGRLREGEIEYVRADIAAVVQAAQGRIVKVIVECGYLDRAQITSACRAALAAGAHFVKTSTGFGPCRAKAEDVRFLRSQVGESMGVKAAGGIATLDQALEMIAAGASRLGTSKTARILAELPG